MPIEGEYEPSRAKWVRDQVAEYESSEGQRGTTLRDTGWPVIVVTNRGNKSGKLRKTPLMRVEHDGQYALVASMGGAPRHPVWYYNLKADPDLVVIQDGPTVFDAEVRELSGDERAQWWERAVAAYPPYAEYQTRTERLIPVFLASPKVMTVDAQLSAEVLGYLKSHRDVTLFCRDAQARPIGYPMMIFAQSPTTVFFSTYRKSKKVQHIERDPRVAVLSHERQPSEPLRWVALNGVAQLWAPTPAEVDQLFAGRGGDSRVPDTMLDLVRQRTIEGKRVLLRIELNDPQAVVVQEEAP